MFTTVILFCSHIHNSGLFRCTRSQHWVYSVHTFTRVSLFRAHIHNSWYISASIVLPKFYARQACLKYFIVPNFATTDIKYEGCESKNPVCCKCV